ncbi:serine O-acetyltransferase [Paraburkholderia sp. DHOC27]|uniref:serine O-acetyltransferase n=1 Tax=Paraburkholderia sp. DHOC27 TaxID=2303330 RepID=UPI000E3C3EED|nr:serine O-acetyltransferase [Paraburkholderia sp. DHOC27]RFU49664.1 serine acetyltransferase [Paraburkholderia sp. DHOC27]
MACTPPHFAETAWAHACIQQACASAQEDLAAFLEKDPAARHSSVAILIGYTSYKAVLHYRLAHALIVMSEQDPAARDELALHALVVASRGKLLSGAEIHPRCQIGRRFVLDHGWGTVIGETTHIGDDCYVMAGVTLGATGIAANPAAKRHPTLGDRVQIGAFASVFGNIQIGDDVFVGAHCLITEDVPSNTSVTLRTTTQISRVRTGTCPLSVTE